LLVCIEALQDFSSIVGGHLIAHNISYAKGGYFEKHAFTYSCETQWEKNKNKNPARFLQGFY
jgi:hypothetical protein